MKNKYILLFVIGVILLIVGLWFSFKGPVVREGLVDMSLVVLGGLGSVSDTKAVYYANTGLTNTPNWQPSTGSTYMQISGSNGYMVARTNTNSVELLSQYIMAGKANIVGSISGTTLTVSSVTSGTVLVGMSLTGTGVSPGTVVTAALTGNTYRVNTTQTVGSGTAITANPASGVTFKNSPLRINGGFNYVFFDFPMLVGINLANKIVYCDNIFTLGEADVTPTPVGGTTPNKTFRQICTALGNAYAIDTDNKIWYTNNVRNPIWMEVTGTIPNPLQVVYDGTSVVAINSAFNLYYSSVTGGGTSWQLLSSRKMKQISLTNGVAVGVGADNVVYLAPSIKDDAWVPLTTGAATMSQVEVFYPANANVRVQRNTANTCSESGYTQMDIDANCYEPCASGYTRSFGVCNGITVPRVTSAPVTVPPPSFACPSAQTLNINGQSTTCEPLVAGTVTGTAPTPLSEVYAVTGTFNQAGALGKCQTYGGVLATSAQVADTMTAGAKWNIQGWLSTQGTVRLVKTTTEISATIPALELPTKFTHGTAGGIGAICFGVKPSKGQFTDVLAFIPAGLIASEQWNQAPPCAKGYKLRFTAACSTQCNTDTHIETPNTCVGKTITKPPAPARAVPFCNTGYSFNGAVTTTCYKNCPANYVTSGTTCVPATTVRTITTPNTYNKSTVLTTRTAAKGGWSHSCPANTQFIFQAERPLTEQLCYTYCLPGEITTGIIGIVSNGMGSQCIAACPSGASRNADNTCSSACPTGYNATNRTTCTFSGATTNRETDVVRNDACDAGQTKGVDNNCYTNSSVGLDIPGTTVKVAASHASQITENITSSKFSDTTRLSVPRDPIASSITPCNMSTHDYMPNNPTGQECVAKCAPGQTQTATTCTPNATTSRSRPVTVVCNANEEVVNGICVSKCAPGTYAKGELCVSERTVVPMPASVSNCISTPYGKYKKWLCDKSSDICLATCEARKLLKDPTDDTTYVDPNDQICVSDDPTMKMYYCQTAAEAKLYGAAADETRNSYDSTCDNLSKNYTDLSGALNTIATIKEDLIYGKTTIGGASDSIQSVYTNLRCHTTSPSIDTSICDKILEGRRSISDDHGSVDTALQKAIPQIEDALNSRNFLRDQLFKFKCKNYTTPPAFSL